eukprot:TRINITY_DN9528_c0_g1_i1.p1 TRINITY_DN9528_c0_g1~~TRINITY_DN9528_c0_g1_i1.p1  ORF type:complete len:726 (-),score=152.78 TRINITY_DN9528_c0_g1_i1:176-2353(-)
MSGAHSEVVTTVRVFGVPFDTDESMFARWFLFARGFVRAAITTGSFKGQVGLVRFASLETAIAAIHALDGRTLSSPEAAGGLIKLSADLATSDLKVPTNGNRPFSELEAQPRVHSRIPCEPPSIDNPPSRVMVISNLSAGVSEREILALAEQLSGFLAFKFGSKEVEKKAAFLHFTCIDACAAALPSVRNSSLAAAYGEQLDCRFAPIGTSQSDVMVIGNLSPEVSEHELNAVLMTFPGFRRLNYSTNKNNDPIAFAHFSSVEACANAMHALHGSAMPSALTQLLVCDFCHAETSPETTQGASLAPMAPGQSSTTLRINSLPMGYTEHELTEFISTVCPGFRSLKLSLSNNGQDETCLVRFTTTDHAQAALDFMMVSLFKNCKHDANFKIEFVEARADHKGNAHQWERCDDSMDLATTAKHPSPAHSRREPPPPKNSSPAVFPVLTNIGGGIKKATFPIVTGSLNKQHQQQQIGEQDLQQQLWEQQHLKQQQTREQQSKEQQQQQQQQREQHQRTQSLSSNPTSSEGRCSTVFSSNLHRNCTEDELTHFFVSRFEGCVRLKFSAPTPMKGGMCWIRFASVEDAEKAISTIRSNAICLPGDPSKPLQVDFAKNDLDCRGVDSRAEQDSTHALMGNPAGDTVFIGALPPEVSEQEILSCLAILPGFLRMKYVTSGPRPVVFAQFDSIESSAQALQVLHGSAFPSAPTQALDCQFSKNSLDSKRPRIA